MTNNTGRMHSPLHPGEVLLQGYLEPMGVTIKDAADALGVSRKHLSAIVNATVPVTPEMAAKLGVVFKTGPDLWVNLQAQHDIWLLSQTAPPKLKALEAA